MAPQVLEHRLSGPGGFGEKRTPYIEDARFPLIVRVPGIETGSTSEAMVQNVDLRPTFAEMVGADVPSYVDGTSLLGEAKGDKRFPRAYAYSEGLTMHGLPRVSVDGPAVKLPTWKATYSPDGAYHQWESGEEEFY